MARRKGMMVGSGKRGYGKSKKVIFMNKGRVKGWKKWSKGWSGKNGNTITLTQRQDIDGRNAFLYGAKIRNDKSLGTGRKTKTLFKEVRNQNLLKKKVSNYIRSHPRG